MATAKLTGTVLDPFGRPYANGKMSADFLPGTAASYTYGGLPLGFDTIVAGLDANGAFTLNVPKSSDVVPTDSKWHITVTSQDGTKNFTIDYAANGDADISSTLNAAAVSLGTVGAESGKLTRGLMVFNGAQTTRATVRAEVDTLVAHTNVAIGSQYNSTAGKVYVKVADAAADTDWQRVTTTAVD